MIVPEERTLLKNKSFTGVLAFGILLSLAGVIVRGIYNGKVANDVCASGTCYGDFLCYQNGGVYCCGTYSGYETCNGFTSCSLMGEDCDNFIIAQWVIFAITVALLIGLIVIAKKHRVEVSRMQVAAMVQGQNVVYSDPNPRNVPRPVAINDSIDSNDYQRV